MEKKSNTLAGFIITPENGKYNTVPEFIILMGEVQWASKVMILA